MQAHVRIYRVLQLITLLRARPAKSIRHLAKALGISERTVYRYLDTLRELGFNIEQDEYMRLSIGQSPDVLPSPFTQQETELIRSIAITLPAAHPLKESILAKLGDPIGMNSTSEILLRTHLGHIFEVLHSAIESRIQVLLKNYQSVHSGEVRDRLVEPIDFTPDYRCVIAYEPETERNNFYNLERIESVEPLMRSFQHENKHQKVPQDVFGFNSNDGKTHSIHLTLTPRAKMLMISEFPGTDAVIIPSQNDGLFELKTEVNSLLAVTRFILGLKGEIDILADDELKSTVNSES